MAGKVNREDRAFQAISGHRALDLLATLRDRHREPTECLRVPADLDRWLAGVELRLETAATHDDLDAARRLRELVYGLVRAQLDGAPPANAELQELNKWARGQALAPQINPTFELSWVGSVEAALTAVAHGAIDLLATPERALIRECSAAPECSRIYLDRSPGRRRRWCQMETCGSSAKMRAYRSRQRHMVPD
jgi:predicted RNA-binding Zn ribbon-like protein